MTRRSPSTENPDGYGRPGNFVTWFMHFSCLLDPKNQPSISTALRPLVGKSDPVKNHVQETTHTVVLLVVQFFVSFKIRLNHFDKFLEQVFVFHGKKFLDFLAVLF